MAWIGGAMLLAAVVVALRHTQPPAGSNATPIVTPPAPTNHVQRFAVDGLLLPAPGERPSTPPRLVAEPRGPDRLRVSWGSALPEGSDPENTVGYEVRWRGSDGSPEQRRLVATPEVQLDGLTGDAYVVEVRSVDAFGRRSAPTSVHAQIRDDPLLGQGEQWSGLYESFDEPLDVDTAKVAGRWHFTGYPGCTRASAGTGAHVGQLTVDLECGGDVTVLRYRVPLTLTSSEPERGRVAVVTDVAGPRGQLTIDLVPGPADQVGAGREGAAPIVEHPNGTAAVDPTLPAGTVRVLVNDDGARVLTGPDVPRTTDPPAPEPALSRGFGVLHKFEVIVGEGHVRVLQDGEPVAVAGIAPQWAQADVLIGLAGPLGRRSRVHLDAVGLSGPPNKPTDSYVHPVIPATQRVLGPGEQAPGIGFAGETLLHAASGRFVASVTLTHGVDLSKATAQFGDLVVPARPVLTVPARIGSIVTMAADLPPQLLGPGAPAAVSPLVLRAPGAATSMSPVFGSYLELTPAPGAQPSLPAPTTGLVQPAIPDSLPSPAVRLLDNDENLVNTVSPGSRVLIDVDLDRIGGQLESGGLAGIAGFELWMDNRRIAGLPTAIDGPGLGGQYSISVSTRHLEPGPHFLELRVIPADPDRRRASRLASFTVSRR